MDPEARDAELAAVRIGPLEILDGPVTLTTTTRAGRSCSRTRSGASAARSATRVLRLEHVGSTSVPGLVAKPRIDILLVVADPAAEASYAPALEAAGYTLRVREPDWHEHRMFSGPETAVNLHVFGPGSPEIERMLRFRDHLRTNTEDRERYAAAKRELAARHWRHIQDYADAKTEVIEAILSAEEPPQAVCLSLGQAPLGDAEGAEPLTEEVRIPFAVFLEGVAVVRCGCRARRSGARLGTACRPPCRRLAG